MSKPGEYCGLCGVATLADDGRIILYKRKGLVAKAMMNLGKALATDAPHLKNQYDSDKNWQTHFSTHPLGIRRWKKPENTGRNWGE